ncbi:MAG TPA: carbohydrate kinase family protein [Candidatus Peribacteria bacterium]|nr:carbohydrate kinase family protein [Candidatus Peribacteria bacterium]
MTPNTSPRTLSIGGATYDVFLKMDAEHETLVNGKKMVQLPVGHKVKVKEVVESCGGGANNTAVGLARLGCNAAFCGVVGDDQWGQRMLENFKREGVDVSSVTEVEHESTSFSIVLSMASRDRTILYTPGVNEHLHDVTFDREAIRRSDAVFLNHLSETACTIEDDLIASLQGDPHIHLTWNPGGCQIDAGMRARDKAALLKLTDLLILNKEEAEAFTKQANVQDALAALLDAGAKNVCITDGPNGTYAGDGTHCYHCPIRKDVKVFDSTGAGDAFGTGATWALLTGRSLPTALVAGTLNAASVIQVLGAQAGQLKETEMLSQLEQHHVTVELLPW